MELDIERLMAKLQTIATPWAYSPARFVEAIATFNTPDGLVLGVALALAIIFLAMEHIAVWQERPEYDLFISGWMPKVLLVLTVLLAANIPSEFIYFEF